MARPRKDGKPPISRKSNVVPDSKELSNIDNNSISNNINKDVALNNNNVDLNELEKEMQEDTNKLSGFNDKNIEDAVIVVDDFDTLNDGGENNTSNHRKIQMPEDEDDFNSLNDLGANDNLLDADDDIPDLDFDPLKERVKERDYTREGSINETQPTTDVNGIKTNPDGTTTNPDGSINPAASEAFIPEPDIKYVPLDDNIDDDISGGLKNKGGGNKNTGGGGNNNNNNGNGNNNNNNGNGNNNNNGGGNNNNSGGGDKKENPNEKLDDLSPKQKREAAEKTADTLILTYTQLVPIPFKKISSFNMRKLQRLDMKNEIKLKNIIDDDGTTVKDYCEGVNEQVEGTFIITKEMQKEIKEPLVDVLLENNLALTPTQRLGIAVAGQMLQMGMVAIQHLQQNRGAMEHFKQFHKDNLEEQRKMNKTAQENLNKTQTQTQAQTQTQTQNTTSNNNTTANNTVKEEQKPNHMTPPPSDFNTNTPPDNNNDEDDDIPNNDIDKSPTPKPTTPIVSSTEKKEEKKESDYRLDEYLTVENKGIEVEEYLDED